MVRAPRYRDSRAGVRAAVLAAAVTALSAAAGAGVAAARPDELPGSGEVAAQFATWNAALRTGDPRRVAGLYADDAVLLPTMSPQVRDSRAEIVAYFTHFLTLRPVGTVTESHVRVLDGDTAVHSGRYRFEVVAAGRPEVVEARFTFVYEKRRGRWLIVEHHSSELPG